MTVEWIIAGSSLIVLSVAVVHLFRKSREITEMKSLRVDYLSSSVEVKETLLKGLYERFRAVDGKETPHDFEHFVAGVLETRFGGTTHVTPASGDFGVDIEHQRSEGMVLIQVKCVKESIGFEPIAIIHSQMVKEKAAGACVATCGTFTPGARSYAEDVGIDLIDGNRLVEYWLQNVAVKTEAWDARVKSPAKGKETGIQEA